MCEFNERVLAAFDNVRMTLDGFRLPLLLQRRYNAIRNATEMLMYDDDPSVETYNHLRSALLALARHDGLEEQHRLIEEVCDAFEAKGMSRNNCIILHPASPHLRPLLNREFLNVSTDTPADSLNRRKRSWAYLGTI